MNPRVRLDPDCRCRSDGTDWGIIRPADRLAPPAELGDAEATIFRQAAATAPAGHFMPEDLPLLCLYARAVVMERRAGEELGVLVAAGKVPGQWLGTYGCVAKTAGARER